MIDVDAGPPSSDKNFFDSFRGYLDLKQWTQFGSGVAEIRAFRSNCLLCGKRSAAAAGSGCVRVGEFEAAAVESRDEVYNCTLEEGDTFGININSQGFAI